MSRGMHVGQTHAYRTVVTRTLPDGRVFESAFGIYQTEGAAKAAIKRDGCPWPGGKSKVECRIERAPLAWEVVQ